MAADVTFQDSIAPSSSDEILPEIDVKISDAEKSSLSETIETVDKVPQEAVTNSQSLSNETAIINTEVNSKATDVPFVDMEALKALENKAADVDRNLHRMMDNITRNLNGISSSSVQYAECYRDCVKNVGNASDTATKAMAKLIGKCEEMNKNMEPLYSMAEQVKMINVLLDQFEEKCK
jgi:hypothetical protein